MKIFSKISNRKYGLTVGIFLILSFSISCSTVDPSQNIDEVFSVIEKVVPIEGADNTNLTVNTGNDSYFRLGFSGIDANDIFNDGTVDGWCIDWQKPINANDGQYSRIKLYSTYKVEGWEEVNYLLNIKESLLESDPDLTYREIQLAVWSLRGFPEFNLNEVPVSELPARMLADGKPNFSYSKVEQILSLVRSNAQNFVYDDSSKFAVIAETPSDVQTVIGVVTPNSN